MMKKMLTGVAASLVVLGSVSTMAFADTTSGSSAANTTTTSSTSITSSDASNMARFEAKYQANLSTEAQLMQQAQSANSTNPTVTALLSTAESIGQQTPALYAAAQALAGDKSSIPNIAKSDKVKDEVAKLNKQKESLLQQADKEWKLVTLYTHSHNREALAMAVKAHAATQKKLNDVNRKLAAIEKAGDRAGADWVHHPYDGGLAGLADSILRLQAAEIHYTKQAIALESQAATPNTSSADTPTSGGSGSGTDNSVTTDSSGSTGTTPSGTGSSTSGASNATT